MAGKPHLIKIRKREDSQLGKPAFVVSPGKQHIRHAERVMFLAQGTDAVIFIPNADTLFGLKQPSLLIEAGAGNQTRSYTIADDLESGQEFPYSVYCDEDNDFAEGGSTPRFIID